MSHLTLFSQVPIGSKFRFESADTGRTFIKINETEAWAVYAEEDHLYQTVNPGVLVFPVPDPVKEMRLTTKSGHKYYVEREGYQWRLWIFGESTTFNSLEDVINHLGA